MRGRTSAFYLKGRVATSPEISRRLDVTYLVRGSVQRSGNSVRIAAQLARAATDEVLWSSPPFTRELKDVFAVQEEIATLIAQNLSLKLDAALGGSTAPMNPEAYRLYLEGR